MPDRKGQTEQPKPAVELRTLLAVYFIKGVLYNFDTFYSVIIEPFFFLGLYRHRSSGSLWTGMSSMAEKNSFNNNIGDILDDTLQQPVMYNDSEDDSSIPGRTGKTLSNVGTPQASR